jgi:hypothetical protein
MRAELDVAVFYLYDVDRDDVDKSWRRSPIAKRKDIQQHGTFRTKDPILKTYDAMAETTRMDTLTRQFSTHRPGRLHDTQLTSCLGVGPYAASTSSVRILASRVRYLAPPLW